MWQNEGVNKLTTKQKREVEQFIGEAGKADEVLRAQVILMLDDGDAFAKVHRLTGFSRTHAFRLRREYVKHGITALKDKRKGKPKEILTKKQRDEVIQTVKTKTPKDFGYTADYWTTGFLGQWIEEAYEVKYKSKTSLYLVFRKATFTYHKPGRIYDKHDENEVNDWKQSNKFRIEKHWQQKDTVILCADEMILTTETTIQKVWLPQGEYPSITCSTGGRKRRNIYGFLNLKTGIEHAFKTEKQNMYVTKEILKEIRKIYPKQKIVLLWDNAGWHKGSIAQEYIKQDGNIEEIPFPRYAPQENPQEHVWKNGRSHVTHNRFIEDIDEATDELVNYFNETKFPYALLALSALSQCEVYKYFLDDMAKDLEDVLVKGDFFALDLIAHEIFQKCLQIFLKQKGVEREKTKRLSSQLRAVDKNFDKLFSSAVLEREPKKKYTATIKLINYVENLVGGKRPKEWKFRGKLTT